MNGALVCGVFALWFGAVASDNSFSDAQYNLINVLLKNYSKQVLPMASNKKPVTVTFDLTLGRLVDVDEKNQFVTFQMGVVLSWDNLQLRWDPDTHMGIKFLNLQNDLVWVPDIHLYNSIDSSGSMVAKIDTAVKMIHNGTSSWLAPFRFKSECKIDVAFFPFDEQVCDLTFGSWTYTGHFIDIVPKNKKLDFSKYVENTEWKIVDILVQREVGYYPEPYPALTYRFRMKRRILFALTNLIIPCVIIAFLAFLSFCLPVECGERITLVITVLLSMTVFMLFVSSFMPATSEVIPLVGKFYLASMVEISVCLLATFLTIKWHHSDRTVPVWIEVLVNKFLADVLLVKRSNCGSCQDNNKQCGGGRANGHSRLWSTTLSPDEGPAIAKAQEKEAVSVNEHDISCIEGTRHSLAVMSERAKRQEAMTMRRNQWKLAAKVLDRFFLLIFLISFLITVHIIFVNAIEADVQKDRNTTSISN